jgi:hypothetical protein
MEIQIELNVIFQFPDLRGLFFPIRLAEGSDSDRNWIANEHYTSIKSPSPAGGGGSRYGPTPEAQARGWEEFEQQLRALGEWDDDAKPARFNPLGAEENRELEHKRAKLERDASFQALIDEIMREERAENGRVLTRDEAWSIAWDRTR